jgi:putative DNA primase/helicase
MSIDGPSSPKTQGLKHQAARAYVRRFGRRVLPLWWVTADGVCACPQGGRCKHPGKHPCGPLVPHGLLQATDSIELIDGWFIRYPDCNIGIDTSDLLVLDADQPHGRDSLAKLEAKHGPLPASWKQYTGRDGEQYWYQGVAGLRGSVGKIGRNLDIRAAGNFAIAPTSITLRPYAWDLDWHPTLIPLATPPDWLVELALAAGSERKGAIPPEEWRALVAQPCLRGQRNDTTAKLTGHLLARGVDPYVTADLVDAWNQQHCVPPLDAEEVMEVVNSICSREFKRQGG